MTVIQPNQNNKMNFLISIFTISIVSASVWGIFLYNQTIDLRHNVAAQEKIMKQSEVDNAELKNSLYRTIDSQKLESLAQEKSFVLENKPEYVRSQPLTANY